jgi:hypothetical protein
MGVKGEAQVHGSLLAAADPALERSA